MGADGHVQMVPINKVPQQFADLVHSDIYMLTGWQAKNLYGTTILWHYWDTEDRGIYDWYSLSGLLDRYEEKLRGAEKNQRLASLFEEQAADILKQIDNDGGLELAENAREFRYWLSYNSDDWEVWT